MRIDDFDGERVEVSMIPTEQLVDIRRQTEEELIDALANPVAVTPASVWREQLSVIDEELAIRWDEAAHQLGGDTP